MPDSLAPNRRTLVRGALLFCLLHAFWPAQLQAQRHPESAGALPYLRDTPDTRGEPEWLNRAPFIRGPMDRYERGRARFFLGTEDAVPYLNYAEDRYILAVNQGVEWSPGAGRRWPTRYVRWDRLGNYMGGSYLRVFTWEEARSKSDNSGYSYIDHKDIALRVGHYSYKALHWTVTAGTDVRTRFTPLTLSQGHLAVARTDLDYKGRDKATFLFNRGRPVRFSEWGNSQGDTEENTPVLMYALHGEHNVGNYARIGSTFLNQFVSFPSSTRSSAWRGDVPYEILGPKTIRVFIADDSPEETQNNGKVYGVDILLEGERDGATVKLSSAADLPDYTFDSRLRPSVTGGTALPGGGYQAVGHEAVVYAFALPPDLTVRSARFRADVAGDYRIGVRQVHDFLELDRKGAYARREMKWPADFTVADASKRIPFKWNLPEGEEPYYTVARAGGKGVGGANRELVSFDYGMPTGQLLAGLDWEANLVGLQLSGEAVLNVQNYMFPVGDNEGRRSALRAGAYWLKGLKILPGDLHLGGELYRLDPDYSGGYDSYRGGMAFHLDEQPTLGLASKSYTQEYGLVEDNDDNDMWADESLQETAQPGEYFPGWPSASTYPGLDANSDNIPDTDRNENFVADWKEPFLMFEADPPEFVYGIDLNNNGLPDFRENDDRPDYPYPRDQRGRHFFLRFNRLGWLGKTFTVGYYLNREIADPGRARALYLRYAYDSRRAQLGSLKIDYDLKRVEDTIADPSYIYVVAPDDVNIIPWINTPDQSPDRPGYLGIRQATPDLLPMRDSWVHTAFLDARYTGIRGMEVGNSLLWMRNSQAEIERDDQTGLLQPQDVRSRFTVVNKIDCNWTRGSLSLRPRFKHRSIYEKAKNEADPRANTSEFIPIATAEYRLTVNTRLVAGLQGMPGLPYKNWDRQNKDGTFGQTDYLGMVKMTAEYQGINTSLFLGYQHTRREYSQSKDQNTKHGTLFTEIVSAF
jgi:hypothetical protein